MELTNDRTLINSVLNADGIREGHLLGEDGEIDAGPALERGGFAISEPDKALFLFDRLETGVYEVHSSVYPEWRKKSIPLAREARDLLFTQTDATELVTRIHETAHAGVRGLSIKAGFRPLAERSGFEFLSLDLLQWAARVRRYRAHGEALREAGLVAADVDDMHDQFFGACAECARHGQLDKGLWLYNQYAALAGYSKATAYSRLPPVIDFDGTHILVTKDSIEEI